MQFKESRRVIMQRTDRPWNREQLQFDLAAGDVGDVESGMALWVSSAEVHESHPGSPGLRGQLMRGLSVVGLLGLIGVAGCGAPLPVDLPSIVQDTAGIRCEATKFVEGVLVVDDAAGLVVEDGGRVTPLIFRMSYSFRWVPGWFEPVLEVLDGDGVVVARTGDRYRIGGKDFSVGGRFWACADVFIRL